MEKLSTSSLLIAFYLWTQHCLITHSQFRADYTYYPEARAWFKVHRVPTDWHEAMMKCYFEGGNLASPNNDKLYSVMRSLMLVQSGPVFTGVHMMNTAGDYFSIEGVPVLEMPLQWAKMEPDNKNNEERSLAILPDGTFADVKANAILPYICYRQKTGNESISSDCGTFAKGYELDPVGNSCYKYHGDCVVWHRAHMVCAAEGGHLVILNSAREAQLMFDRYSTKPINCNGDTNTNAKRFYHIGCHNIDLNRAYWFTLDGKRIEDSGYAMWAEGEPSSDTEQCCSLTRENVGLNDIHCGHPVPFICEITNPKTQFNATSGEFRDDYQFSAEAKGWIKTHRVPATWLEARLKCYYEGAVLMSPINEKLYAVMRSLMLSRSDPSFIGVQSLTATGDYLSVEGVNLLKMPIQWAKGEPDNQKDNERCLAILTDGTVADVICGEPRTYMCYKKQTGNETITECGTSDKEYTLSQLTGSCYKYHADCVTWWRAHMACSSEGGYLVIVNSAEEANMLNQRYGKLRVKCPEERFIHVGFHNPYEDRAYWFTIDGKRLEEAGYDHWAPNEPNNVAGIENCGSLARNGAGFNDWRCHDSLPFVCEIPIVEPK